MCYGSKAAALEAGYQEPLVSVLSNPLAQTHLAWVQPARVLPSAPRQCRWLMYAQQRTDHDGFASALLQVERILESRGEHRGILSGLFAAHDMS